MKKKFYLQGKDFAYEILRKSDNIRFEWNMLYACNFRCSYCFFNGKWEEYGKRTVYLDADQWFKCWKKIYKMYGRVSLVITGGEPFIYPDFINIIDRLSQMHYPINISTNASGDLKEFVETVDSKKISLTLAFHPEFDTLDDILVRLKYLKGNGFVSDYINFCAYPPLLKNFDEYIGKVNQAGEKLKVIPFCGRYNNINYPDGYTKEEKEKIGLDATWEENVKKKGDLCAAGYKSALLFPDGKVVRCGQVGEKLVIGNFFSNDFNLLDGPLPCDAEICPCLEVVTME